MSKRRTGLAQVAPDAGDLAPTEATVKKGPVAFGYFTTLWTVSHSYPISSSVRGGQCDPNASGASSPSEIVLVLM